MNCLNLILIIMNKIEEILNYTLKFTNIEDLITVSRDSIIEAIIVTDDRL